MDEARQPKQKRQPVGLPAPTVSYLEALRKELAMLYEAQDQQIDLIREIREQRRRVNLPSDYKLVDIEVRDPTITDEIMRLVAMLTVNQPKLIVDPRPRRGDRVERNATLREQWTEAMLRQAGPGVFEDVMDAVCGDGGAWTKFLFHKDRWAQRYGLRLKTYMDEDARQIEAGRDIDVPAEQRFESDTEAAKQDAGQPFSWTMVDARTLWPLMSNGVPHEVLEIQQRPVSQVMRQYRLGTRVRNGEPEVVEEELAEPISPSEQTSQQYRTCEVWEHWEQSWVTYAIQYLGRLKIVKQWRHRYGRPPYFYALGYRMNYWRNRKVGWGVSNSKRWLVEYRAFLWTLHAQIAARDTRPLLFLEQTDAAMPLQGNEKKPQEPQRWTPGEIIEGLPGQRLTPVNMPNIANSLREQIMLVSEQIQNLESPRVKGPLGGGMEGAGFAISQLLTEAKTKDNPLVAHVEDMYRDITGFAWGLIRNKIKEKVWLWRDGDGDDAGWLGVGPDDLQDSVSYRWKLDPERASAKMVEARYYHERLQAGTIDWSTAVSAMGENPDEIRIGQAEDRIRNGQWYQQLLEKEVAEAGGRGDAVTDAQAAQTAQTGMPPGINAAQMGGPGDNGALGQAPQGQGAAPQSPVAAGIAPPNGNVVGVGPAAVVPTQAATASIQNLGV